MDKTDCYLYSGDKSRCTGCGACVQVCPVNALNMERDAEGFAYPVADSALCIACDRCLRVCPAAASKEEGSILKAFGGYARDCVTRERSTSGGAFSVIADAWCQKDYVIFGAACDGLKVYHTYITDKAELDRFRKSKYSQSDTGTAYADAKKFLKDGKSVVFSGTPCQIAALNSFLDGCDTSKLLTVEVICEGVPTPLYVNSLDAYLKEKYGGNILSLDYRYTDPVRAGKLYYGKWDFQVMNIILDNGKVLKKDRWFNPFWEIWLSHLMSRPSCYRCPYTTVHRGADISLGDLWGVHIYCPELYGNNLGSSLIICSTEKGVSALEKAEPGLYGHDLDVDTAVKYQSPMRKTISGNQRRDEFMHDVRNMKYPELIKKWYKGPDAKLLKQKYLWGNRQKVLFRNIKSSILK